MPHLYTPNDPLDFFRIVLFLISAYAVVILLMRYREGGKNWNIKTKDQWYSLLMWSLAGCALSLQGIALNRPFTPVLVFAAAAIFTTGKAVHRKGDWGNNAS